MPPRSVFDIVKSHLHLPINRDYDALKRVLRDWHHYSVRVPLQAKPAFPAELHITITRPSPAAQGGNKTTTRRTTNAASVFGKSSRRWSLWRRGTPTSAEQQQQQQQHLKDNTGSTDASPDAAPKVYTKVIPLHVWTAVLPWEMQRGLSFSELRLPNAVAADDRERATVEEQPAKPPSAAVVKKKVEDEEEEDPYGVVTSSAAAPPSSTAAPSAPPKAPAISVTAPTPAMLFLSDMVSTRSYGIGFWSGGIVQPIDVYFVAPTLPVSVGPHSPSFQQLREQDGRAAVEENHVSQEVLTRYFPLQEVSPPAALLSAASSVTFQVHSFSHLDPLPPSLHPSRLDTAEGRAAATGRSLTATPDAPYASLEESPRYVFEAPRHTLQPAVAAALKESRRLVMKECGAAADQESSGTIRKGEEDADVVIDMTVRMSADLRADLFAKAQLCVEYVSLLEEAIAHYAQELNTDHTALAMSAQPLDSGAPDVAAAGAGREERNRPIKVWLSEHESRWMTPDELRRAAQLKPDEDHHEDEGEEDTEGRQQHPSEEEEVQAEKASPSSLAPQTYPAAAAATAASTTSVAARAAQAVGATAAQPGAVTRSRSIGRQSPMLVDETEGRPSYLAPSFVGRHESATLQQSAVVLSADKLARYPKTHSHMPQLPPIDYELFDLCTRLGVGQQAILYHYHDRMLKEWRTELQRRRSAQSGTRAVEKNASLPPPIDPDDVDRMVALVRDRSLQVSPELVALVEAVAAVV